MTQLTQLTKDVFAVEVPEDASAIETHVIGEVQKIVFSSEIQDPAQCGGDMICLPPGTWHLICTTREVSAMHAPELFGHAMISDHYARETVNGLLTSKGLDVSKNYALLKKEVPNG